MNQFYWFIFPISQVYDYDWGLRDDFMGQAQVVLSQDNVGEERHMRLTLVEAGQVEYLGQVSLKVKISSVLPDTPEHRRASQAVSAFSSPAR